jgi:UDP-glucuronate 4-epimerase
MSKLRGPVLVTGAAGFVGFHFSRRLLEDGWQVVGIDNLNAYYDPKLKNDRIAQIAAQEGFHFEPLDLVDANGLESLFQRYHFPFVVHLAAQAGVRYSLENPRAAAAFMVPIEASPSMCSSMSTIRSASMPRPRRQTN